MCFYPDEILNNDNYSHQFDNVQWKLVHLQINR